MFINIPLIIVPPCSNGASLDNVIYRSQPVERGMTPFFDDLASVGPFEGGPKSWRWLLMRKVDFCNRCAGRCSYHCTYIGIFEPSTKNTLESC